MVRFALSKSDMYIPQDLEARIFIYHGSKDQLVLDKAVLELVQLLRERNCKVTYKSVEGGDHNSVLAQPENLQAVMESLSGTASRASSVARIKNGYSM